MVETQKKWRQTKGGAEKYVDKKGVIYGHVIKYKNEGWRAFVKNNPFIDSITSKPKNFKTIEKAKKIVEILIGGKHE